MELIVLKSLRFSSFTSDEHAFQEVGDEEGGYWKIEEAAKKSDGNGRCHIEKFYKISH